MPLCSNRCQTSLLGSNASSPGNDVLSIIMANKEHKSPSDDAQLLALACLADKTLTWDELQAATEFDDDLLGDVLADLLTQHKVRTGQRNGVRVYWLVDTRV